MSRWLIGLGLGALLVVAVLGTRVAGQSGNTSPPPAPAWEDTPAGRLHKPFSFKGLDDPKTTLKEALDILSDAAQVRIEINEEGLVGPNGRLPVERILELQVATRPMRKQANVTLEQVLSRLLAKHTELLPLGYLVRNDHIEVTSLRGQRAEIWGDAPGPYLPLIHAQFEEVPLSDALKVLAEQSGLNIVIDARAREKSTGRVSARFINTPVDSATRLLSDMVDLRPYLLDNTLYVTTPENAELWERRDKIRAGEEEKPPRIGQGRRPMVEVTAPGM